MKTVLITGISRGIGKALCQKFLKEGYRVIGTYISNKPEIEDTSLVSFELDLSRSDSIQGCVQHIIGLNETIDIVINNAGALFDDEIVELRPDLLRKTLEVNVIGTADFTEQILGTVAKDGHIVFIASSAGSLFETDYKTHSHHPGQYPAYKISKAALNMYMRTLAMRMVHDDRNITVSSVHPGWVKTDMGGNNAPITPEEAADDIYMLAISRPETGQFWFKGNKYPW